ncbi:MAG: PD-(D/E)XK nuclease family protein, partial [Gammaproteobacteria bacterium]|nr:PD-(D/E)XK nuclease family protein [Gammaproteobacteria bacterium]
YERLLQLAAEPDNKLSKALQRASTLLPRWQKLAEQLPVHDCLDKIFSEGNIIKRYIAANKAENKQKVAANCQRFLELSLEIDSGRYPGITRFLQRLTHLGNYSDSPPEEPLSQSNESRVKLMTIHGSKGLEAPVVFLADCNSTSSNKNAYASLIRWPASKSQPVNFQLQLSKDNTDQITQKIQQEKLNEQAREDLNLLYVALTRAREQLYISGIKSSRKQNNSWYQIISSGLEDITESETGFDEISYRIHRHLAYENTVFDRVEKPVSRQLEIDERLLKPVSQLPQSSFVIAPSLYTDKGDFYDTAEIIPADAEKNNFNNKDITFDNTLNSAKWRGVIIHRVIEQLCKTMEYPAKDRTIGNIQQQLKTEISLQNPAIIKHLDSCVQEAVSVFNHADFKRIFNPAMDCKTYNEMPLMYMQEQQAVYGIVDRVIKSADTVLIIDYKSHQLDKTETPQDAALQFSGQLDYYRNGIKKMWPEQSIKTGILFTHHKEIVWIK